MKTIHLILSRLYASRAKRLRKKSLREHSRAMAEADHRLAIALRECQAMELFAGKHRRVASCKFFAGTGNAFAPVIYSKPQECRLSVGSIRRTLSTIKLVQR